MGEGFKRLDGTEDPVGFDGTRRGVLRGDQVRGIAVINDDEEEIG